MKLSLVEKNILKSTGYKCYCTGMTHKCTQDHVTDQNGGSGYQVSNHFHLECSKYLKCFCIIPSAFNVKETSIKVRQIGFIYTTVLLKYIHTFVQKRKDTKRVQIDQKGHEQRSRKKDDQSTLRTDVRAKFQEWESIITADIKPGE